MAKSPPTYPGLDGLPPKSVPVTVLILAKDEEPNMAQCLASVQWAAQCLVIDSGSTDQTMALAGQFGAEVVETYWRGFGEQREFALRLGAINNDWVYFVDADEWVSVQLAREIGGILRDPKYSAYWQYSRLIFQGQWIRHCGWYPSARVVRLMNRDQAHFEQDIFSEHAHIDGPIGRLKSDLIDEDHKGLAQWLRKHVSYAELEAESRVSGRSARKPPLHASQGRAFLKDRIAPRLPARPLLQFFYMYVLRAGFLDGRNGLLFCFFHSWFQVAVQALIDERRLDSRSGIRPGDLLARRTAAILRTRSQDGETP